MTRLLLHDSKIGIVPLNWSYDGSDSDNFVKQIAEIGFEGLQISGEQAESNDFLRSMKHYELTCAEHYLAIRCDESGPLKDSEVESLITLNQAINAGVEMLVVAVDGSPDRDQSASHVDTGPVLSETGFKELAAQIAKIAEIALKNNLKTSFHPHAATFIETPEETAQLMTLLPISVGLCLDVGHWLVGGGDPVDAVHQYQDRITHIHIKDVDESVLKKLRALEITSMEIAVVAHKLFIPAGTGVLELPQLLSALTSYGYTGWLMSEQDPDLNPTIADSVLSFENIIQVLTNFPID
jgi:inosose dehydratase